MKPIWITKHVVEGFCNTCGGSSPTKQSEDDVEVIEKSAYDKAVAALEAERDELKRKGENLCCEVGNLMLERDQLRDESEALKTRCELTAWRVLELEALQILAHDKGLRQGAAFGDEEAKALRAQVTGLREALERIVSVRCAWQLSQEIAREALEKFK